jgi:hypothetical protein
MAKYHYFSDDKFGLADLGSLAVIVYPDRWQFAEYCAFVDGMAALDRTKTRSVLVWANGQSLSAAERKLLAEKMPAPKNAPPMRQALLTDSALFRGVMTAMGWLMNKADYAMKAFPTSEVDPALEWLSATAQFKARDGSLALETLRATLALHAQATKRPRLADPSAQRTRSRQLQPLCVRHSSSQGLRTSPNGFKNAKTLAMRRAKEHVHRNGLGDAVATSQGR